MSTKSTIAYGNSFHLYHEVLDEDYVYLRLESVQFEAGYNRVMVPIPAHIWEFIRQYPGVDLKWADRTDAQTKKHVESEVDERLAKYKSTDSCRSGLTRILGSMVYGTADALREKQIASGIDHFTKLREHQQQQQVMQAIKDLERIAAD